MTAPAGAATATALPKAQNGSVKNGAHYDATYCGRRYGGSSRVKVEGTPFSKVNDRILETISVTNTPNTTSTATAIGAARWLNGEDNSPKNTEASIISVGKRPLHGMKLFVIMAMRRSRGESIIRAAITPAALHPNPMLIVRACLP